MNNNKIESQELLRLFKCAVNTGTEVLSAFAGSKLLQTYSGCFNRFLDDKKHQMFHLWQSKKLLCCACSPAGCSLKRANHMDNWIFKKFYDDNGNEDSGHIVRKSGRVEQVCLHKYITRNIAIHELDISAISFLLRNLVPLSQNETTALDTVTKCRSKICHAHSMQCYSITELNMVWNELENAMVDLADPFYKRLIRQQIKDLRKINLEKEEITELLNKVAEVNAGVTEVKNWMSSKNNAIEKCEENLKRMVADESLEIQQSQQVVLQEVISSKAIAKESGDNMLEQFEKLNINQTEMKGQLKEIVEMVHKIHGTTFSVKYEQFTDLSEYYLEDKECLVLWQLATPANWNPIEIEQILTKFNERFGDLPFRIKFVRNGSLVIMTTIAAKDLKKSTTVQTAVKSFLSRMVEVCNIDTKVSCNVDVKLHILKSDELNLNYNLPHKHTDHKFVQTEDTSTDYGNQSTTDTKGQDMENKMFTLPNKCLQRSKSFSDIEDIFSKKTRTYPKFLVDVKVGLYKKPACTPVRTHGTFADSTEGPNWRSAQIPIKKPLEDVSNEEFFDTVDSFEKDENESIALDYDATPTLCMECVKPLQVYCKEDVQAGDHIGFPGFLYDHHAIVVDVVPNPTVNEIDIEIVHASNNAAKATVASFNPFGNKARLKIDRKRVNFEDRKIVVYKYNSRFGIFSPHEIVERAKGEVNIDLKGGKGKFQNNLFENNSEHFATWCVTGKKRNLHKRTFARISWMFLRSGLHGISDENERNNREFEHGMLCTSCYERNKAVFNVETRKILQQTDVNVGDIITYSYYNLWHNAVILGVNGEEDKYTTCDIAHYAYCGPFKHHTIVKEKLLIPFDGSFKVLLYKSSYFNTYTPQQVVERAHSRLNEQEFAYFLNDSNQFARWCKLKLYRH